MEYEYLYPVLKQLIDKYCQLTFVQWQELYEAGEELHDYSDNADELPGKIDEGAFWQAHTDVLEIGESGNGRFANVSTTVYPWGIHSSPPAPCAGMLVYESGICDVGLPWEEYSFDQNIGQRVDLA